MRETPEKLIETCKLNDDSHADWKGNLIWIEESRDVQKLEQAEIGKHKQCKGESGNGETDHSGDALHFGVVKVFIYFLLSVM